MRIIFHSFTQALDLKKDYLMSGKSIFYIYHFYNIFLARPFSMVPTAFAAVK